MVNITIWSHKYAEIESKTYHIRDRDELVKFVRDILDKVHYSGESTCLEIGDVASNEPNSPIAQFTTIDKWK